MKQITTSLDRAKMFTDAGISIIPCGVDKRPMIAWSDYQNRIATDDDLKEWFGDRPVQIATICGQVSQNLMVIDFDKVKIGEFKDSCVYRNWTETETAKRLMPILVINSTPSGGFHLRFRIRHQVEGNQKLAMTDDGQVLIETRGEGGYALSPPSTGYEIINGSSIAPPILDASQSEDLIQSLISFDMSDNKLDRMSPSDLEEAETHAATNIKVRREKHRPLQKNQESVADLYNQTDDFKSVLTDHGWQIGKEDADRVYWIRPNKDIRAGHSATWHKENRVFTNFSANAHPLQVFAKQGDGYSPFKLYGTLNHNSNFSAAAKELLSLNPDWRRDNSWEGKNQVQYRSQPVDQEIDLEQEELMIHEIVKQADAPFNIKEMVPAGSWLEKYYDFLTASTDAPDQYVLGSGLSIMGMMFRSVSLEFGVITIRPNIWLTIVGRSTMFRKSTVLNATKSVLRDLDCLQLPEQTTPEAFLGMLSDNDYGHAEGFFNWYEMGAVLKNYQKSHMRAMLEILTELYDCPDRYTRLTKTEGMEEVDNPFISILGATTQRWLNDSISSGDVEGGFLPRFLWLQASRKTRHHPIPKAWNQNEKIRVQDELREMADNYQGCQFYLEEDSPAYHLYSDYHLRTEKEIARHPESDTIGSFYARILTYAIKFSMIFHIMLHPKQLKPELALSAESMKLAIIWADFFKANVDLVTDSMAFDPKGADRKRIVQIIAANPAISRKMLLKTNSVYSKRWPWTRYSSCAAVERVKHALAPGRPSAEAKAAHARQLLC